MGGDLTLYIPGEAIAGYLAMPSQTGPWPGVVVLHQTFGLDDDIRRITDRLAGLGYLAVAPDLLADGGFKSVARLWRDVRRGQGELVETAQDVVDWILDRSDCNGRVGVIGFCVGGGLAFLLGTSGTVDAVAANYGKPPASERLARSCPVVASFGQRDRIFARGARPAQLALARAGIAHDVKIYEGAGHGFMNHTEGHPVLRTVTHPAVPVAYHREAAEHAWGRIEAFFGEHLMHPT